MANGSLTRSSTAQGLSPSQIFLLSQDIPHKLTQLENAWTSCRDLPSPDETVNLLIMVDSLCGYCAGHGFTLVNQRALKLNEFVQEITQRGAVTDADATKFTELVRIIRESAQQTAEGKAPSEPAEKRKGGEKGDDGEKTLVIYTEDDAIAREISLQVGHYGYATQVRKPARLAAVPKGANAVLFDFDDLAKDKSAATKTRLISEATSIAQSAPLIAISSMQDFDARLDAVRCGASAYFIKPINVATLIDKIEDISAAIDGEPYKIMIMDDSKTAAESIKKALIKAGMEIHIVANHKEVLRELAEFHPDLILMDMYMDGCNGNEVAAIIRQNEAHVSIPIVYLSSETDPLKQLQAMGHGADDFLTKPIRPEQLVLSVTNKIERYRLIRKFMTRDSLTGLLNHTKTKQHLDIALAKARRENTVVSFAMIDIDHFKKVNDTYGHPVGDRVIKSLAMLLQQRLRKSDVIGRYGGEEFAVVLAGIHIDLAKTIFDRIRTDFSLVYHHFDDRVFNATISIGLASFPDFHDPAAVSLHADKALYEAKRGGRNRVVLARGEGT